MTGKIKSLSSGNATGFISGENGLNAYFESRAMMEYDISALAVGQVVTFDLENGGRPKAVNVCVQKSHRPSQVEIKRQESIRLRYMGFEQRVTVRAYRFEQISPGEQTRTFFVTTDLALFKKYRVGIQEGPALCLHLLTEELDAADLAGKSLIECSLSDREMLAYLASRPVPGARNHARRPPRPATATTH
jgi:cold shock CspA family protein